MLTNSFPLKIKRIETYIQILRPLYFADISFQDIKSSKADVIPSILNLISILTSYNDKSAYTKALCKDLVDQLNKRFEFESNSEIYKVNNLLFL